MKVTILLGSVREGRKTHRVAYYVEKKLNEKGVETDLIDLGEEELPMYGLADKSEEERERIASVGKRLTWGDALIFVSPEYQDSFSGVLKNALDHYLEEFEKKAIGVVTVSSGKMAGINASIQLQLVILGVGAYPMPYKLLIPHI
ncbi:MAG TPA: NAD(P)H-dependent oxidoreductase, partial [Balneolaceae bacterium]|nr:NAD(P)H-dependent oxidoreductase [Balneolaceae bacterium]